VTGERCAALTNRTLVLRRTNGASFTPTPHEAIRELVNGQVVAANSCRYSTYEKAAPPMPCTLVFVDSIT